MCENFIYHHHITQPTLIVVIETKRSSVDGNFTGSLLWVIILHSSWCCSWVLCTHKVPSYSQKKEFLLWNPHTRQKCAQLHRKRRGREELFIVFLVHILGQWNSADKKINRQLDTEICWKWSLINGEERGMTAMSPQLQFDYVDIIRHMTWCEGVEETLLDSSQKRSSEYVNSLVLHIIKVQFLLPFHSIRLLG